MEKYNPSYVFSLLYFHFFVMAFSFQLNSYQVRVLIGGFYPQRISGQAVVTGVVPSPPSVDNFSTRDRFVTRGLQRRVSTKILDLNS